mmetsp:Transcript_14179/g.20950  ORF Transcript_14179/g.20950 Transcript_14179/m.20950 type:complete len:442 (-) Transcript_14179:306-1631(-)
MESIGGCLLHPFACSGSFGEFTTSMCAIARLYSVQIVVLAVLSGITYYRREMSCNHVYVQDEKETTNEDGSIHFRKQDDEHHGEAWDKLLEEAGTWGSGKSLGGVILLMWKSVVPIFSLNPSSEWSDEQSDKVLESSSMYLSGEPLMASLFLKNSLQDKKRSIAPVKKVSSKRPSSSSLISRNLPSDMQVQVLSFLHPRDIMSYASCNKEQQFLVDDSNNDATLHLWKTLWDRDYAWLIESWSVGRKVQEKIDIENHHINKMFYFEFGQTYLGYLLAGHNTNESCLVALHGNIYDISNFLDEHPGTPETLLVHGGRDATKTFEDVNHSRGARKMSKSMCVTVDLFCYGGCGVRKAQEMPNFDPSHVMMENRRQTRKPETLKQIRRRLELEEKEAKRQLIRLLPPYEALDNDIQVYYDSVERNWKAWYTDVSFQTQYLDLTE